MSDAPIQAVSRHAAEPGGIHDFDFLHGNWEIRNRRLSEPTGGPAEWYEFRGRAREIPLWGQQANVEEYEATLPDGQLIRGVALRLYEPGSGQWTIHWATSATGRLDPPMTGSFRAGIGEFLGQASHEGRQVLQRFLWSSEGPNSARWEQSLSPDGGATWQVNWIMEFSRVRHYR